MLGFRLLDLSPAAASDRLPEVLEVYRATWDAEHSLMERLETRIRTSFEERPGTRLLIIEEEATGRPVAMLFGHGYRTGTWWPQQVDGPLHEAGLGEWTEDAFELVELAALPEHRGHGLGTELLAHLHRTMPERTSLLSTEPDNPARRLYRRAGYLELLPGFRYPITGSPAVVMGRRAG